MGNALWPSRSDLKVAPIKGVKTIVAKGLRHLHQTDFLFVLSTNEFLYSSADATHKKHLSSTIAFNSSNPYSTSSSFSTPSLDTCVVLQNATWMVSYRKWKSATGMEPKSKPTNCSSLFKMPLTFLKSWTKISKKSNKQ